MAGGLTPMFLAPTWTFPTLPALTLTDEEQGVATGLATRLFQIRPQLELHGLYYDGLQKMQDLGISIPPQLSGLRTVVGWPAIGIDALVNRSIVEGFRYPGATDVDEDLASIWQANNLDGESQLAHIDALVYGRAYGIVGPGDESTQGEPLITYESPVNMVAIYDARTRRVSAALQVYLDTDYSSEMYGLEVAALYLQGRTIQMTRNMAGGGWEITDRDEHGMLPPVARIANRQRLQDRDGKSEIRPAWMNTVDSACRTLLGAEVGREFYHAPRRWALGVTEEAFQNADGSPRTAWDTYLHKVWMLERDENGDLPQVGQFAPSDPSANTKLFEMYAKVMAGEMGLPPHMLGINIDGNPASADAIRSGYEELTSRSKAHHIPFGEGHEALMRIALEVKGGPMPDNVHRLETDWRNPAPETLSGTSDAITKQITVGAIPATSDVTLKHLGYSPAERARLAQDRLEDQGQQILREIATNVEAKDIRAGAALVKSANTPATAPAAAPAKAPVKSSGDSAGG